MSAVEPARAVDFCVGCYERTYRAVLSPGFIPTVAADSRYPFARRTVIINNVADRRDAEERARALRSAGELDDWLFVEDHLARALELTGVPSSALAGPVAHFTDWALVLVTAPGSEWALFWDAEIRMRDPGDWVTPSLRLMEADPRVMVANPRWEEAPGEDTLAAESTETAGDFALGLGFSDQLFLFRRSELAAPIYGERCLAMRRYPLAHLGDVFEARVDAWMRHHGRLRATYRPCTYVHPRDGGEGHPDASVRERVSMFTNRAIVAALRASPAKRACWRGV